jgi:hypothetical protein
MEQLMGRVSAHTGADEERARAALLTTAAALGGGLPPEVVQAARERWPDPIMDALASATDAGPMTRDALVEAVAAVDGLRPGQGAEVAQVACEVLTTALTDAGRDQLRRAVAPELAGWIQPERHLPRGNPDPLPPTPSGHDLASGRPGSNRPVSDTGLSSDSLATARSGSDKPVSDSKPE